MPLTRIPSRLDSVKSTKQKLGEEIMALREQIAHYKTYEHEKDTGALELKLEALLQQQRRFK